MIQFQFYGLVPEQQEILIAQLTEIGFDGFEETSDYLFAYITEGGLDRKLFESICLKYCYQYQEQSIQDKNWNEDWESNFQPVKIENFVGIRADFHPNFKDVEIELLITPKMSFGTGHHATTWLMVNSMKTVDFKDKLVLDFGTGTGVLAILAEKMGASRVLALDNDDWSLINCQENILMNHCSRIEIRDQSSLCDIENRFDIILANINRNVIIANLRYLPNVIKQDSVILFSGLLDSDEKEVTEALENQHLTVSERTGRSGWICLRCLPGGNNRK